VSKSIDVLFTVNNVSKKEVSPNRILLLLPEAFERPGGIQRFCRALCLASGRWARREGARVSAIVLNDQSAPDARYVNGSFDRFVTVGKKKRKFIASYLRMLSGTHFDLIISAHVSLAPLALFAAPLTGGAKTAVIAYGIEVWQPLSLAQRAAVRRADAVLSISDYTTQQLAQRTGIDADKISLLPCSLDPFWEELGTPDTNGSAVPMMLSVVRMEKEDRYKGIDSVIRSLPAIVREFGPVDYRIIGRGNDIPSLKALADELGVTNYITFAGELCDQELQDYYRRCTLFVMPSEREGFGIVFLEAMAYGKAVVGGAHGGTPSVVSDGETGLLVHSSDVEGLTNALVRLLRDKELRERLGHAGRERLQQEFTFEKFQDKLDTFFKRHLSFADRTDFKRPKNSFHETTK
jgi:glycosyltransferase involved in cell wall biosynthesis